MILDGKVVAADIKQRLAKEIGEALVEGKRVPHLVIISVGEDSASKVYVRNKMKAATEIGIVAWHFPMQAELVSTEYVKETISLFNEDPNLDGIMVQLPLPKHLDERAIIDTIDPAKDVDGLTTTNIGRLRSGQPGLRPCTAKGVIDLCKYYSIDLDGKDVTIVGRSNIVGKPLADMMMSEGATVTQCHSHTIGLTQYTTYGDIVITAVGKPKMFGSRAFGLNQIIIDVGINRDADGKLCGDVDFEAVKDHCDGITPVPGGVGPLTVAELMSNTVECWRKRV